MNFKVASLLYLSLVFVGCGKAPEPIVFESMPVLPATPAGGKYSITVDIFDPKVEQNPVRSFRADKMTIAQMMPKLGNLRSDQSVALVCEGDYNPKFGWAAFDIIQKNRFKLYYMSKTDMTLDAVCWKEQRAHEARLRELSPSSN